jgi:hypothetical protein
LLVGVPSPSHGNLHRQSTTQGFYEGANPTIWDIFDKLGFEMGMERLFTNRRIALALQLGHWYQVN